MASNCTVKGGAKMRRLFRMCPAGVLFAGVLGGCSGSGSSGMVGADGTGAVQKTSGPYEPLAVNASWTYQVQDSGTTYQKVSAVEDTEDAGGPAAGITVFRLTDTFPSNSQTTWYQVDGNVVKRLHDNSLTGTGAVKDDDWYDPFRLRVDESPEHLVAGAAWTLQFTDNHTGSTKPPSSVQKTDQWHVDGMDEPVTVPAGTFLSLRVSRTDPNDGSVKSYWFVRGVGKVKENSSSGHLEELTSYQKP
jgi:hypothetical protein